MNNSLTLTPILEDSNKQTHDKNLVDIKQIIVLCAELFLALPLGFILLQFNIGGIAWIFGGMIAGAVVFQSYRVLYEHTPKLNRTARKIGMVLVGLAIGFSNAHANLNNVASGIPVFALLTIFMLVSGSIIGYIYSRISKTNILTAMLATVPGGVGVMSSIAADYGRNVTLVALVQVIRVTSVVLLIPMLARASVIGNSVNQQSTPLNIALFPLQASNIAFLLLALLLAFVVINFAVLCKIPAAHFFSALLVGMSFNTLVNVLPFVSDVDFMPPRIINILGQLLLGVTIGEYWGEKPNLSKKSIVYALICCGMTLLAGIFAALLAWELTPWDWLTCLLVTAPGGSAEMILVALSLNHNVEIVTAGHLIRLLAINCSLPLWIFLFRRFDNM
jgi:uncharacterized protein